MSNSKALIVALFSLLLAACWEGGGPDDDSDTSGNGGNNEEGFANVTAYIPEANHSAVIVNCISAETIEASCSLDDLPLIGMERDDPSIEQIMERVVVSHTWMGDRFRQALTQMPADILTLLKSVTAIVIDDDIRPAYYWDLTGAIYLDPARLWLTNAEKITINTKEDFRSDFDNQLAFRSLWRYVKDGNYAYNYYSLEDNTERNLDDIIYPLAALLYHELAHANDFFPADIIDTLDSSLTVFEASVTISGQEDRISHRIDHPTSTVMSGLARVMFGGQTPTDEQRGLSAQEVGADFEIDTASDDYGYYTVFEDVAMLFEETMMKYHFDVDRQLAFTSVPTDPSSCSDYVIGWGNHNRIGDSDVKSRAQVVVGAILPGLELSTFFQDLRAPTNIEEGSTWCTIANPDAIASPVSGKASIRAQFDQPVTAEQTLRHH